MRRLSTLLAVLLCSALAQGQGKPPEGKASARVHFKDAVDHAARGELEAALQDFEAAYALQPHYSVLYNIGQAEAALGKPASAIRTLERYLVEGGDRLSQARRDEVRALLDQARRKLGELRLIATSPTTRVWIDGVEIERGALAQPISLPLGTHYLISSDAGGPPLAQTVLLKPASITELRLDPPQPRPKTILTVACSLPGVTVEIDGASVASTPVREPLLVTAGAQTVRFLRPGYRDVTHKLVASTDHATNVACNLTQDAALPPEVGAALTVRTTPRDAIVLVDGQRFRGAALPMGQHELSVERDGYTTSSKTITLRAHKTTSYDVTLQPTEAYQRRRAKAASSRRTFGYVGLGGGFTLIAGGVGLLAWNGGRYSDWRDSHSSGGYAQQLRMVSSIQRVDDIAIASMAFGTGLVATAAWLLLTKPPISE